MVLDASSVLELLLNTASGRKLAGRIRSRSIALHAPHLLDLEIAQALRRYLRAGIIDVERGSLALHHLGQLDLHRYAHEPLLPRIWSLRQNLTAYDAAYVALAEALEVPLLTCDAHLARAPGIRARIEVLEGDR